MNFFLKIYYVYFSKFGVVYNKINSWISHFLNFKEINLRKKLYKKKISLIKNNKIDFILSKLNTNGYYMTNLKEFDIDFDISQEINSSKIDLQNQGKKTFFKNLYSFEPGDKISKFSINKNFIELISKYLKLSPIINNILLIKSEVVSDKKFYSSMNWHIDNHHNNLIKIMYLPHDLNYKDGPTCFLNKNSTQNLLKNNFYFKSPRYFEDDELKKVNNNYTDEIVSFTGKKGDILIIDTSKCLHMGSRCNSERYQLFITYTPIETNDLNTLSSIKKYQFLNEKIKNLNIY
jgi:hypothetical protein